MSQKKTITGLILAGGAGTRVGGLDKGLLRWKDKPLVEHVANRLRGQTSELLLSCNRNIDEYRAMGFNTVVDKLSGFQGPLAGIEAALRSLRTEFLLVVACDTPRLPLDLADRLLAPFTSAAGPEPGLSYAHDGQRDQYLFALLNRSCQASLAGYLLREQRAVRHWYHQVPHTVVDFSDQPESFQNFNTLAVTP